MVCLAPLRAKPQLVGSQPVVQGRTTDSSRFCGSTSGEVATSQPSFHQLLGALRPAVVRTRLPTFTEGKS